MKKKLYTKAQGQLVGAILITLYFAVMLYLTSKIDVSFTMNVGWADAKTFPYIFNGIGLLFSIIFVIKNIKTVLAEKKQLSEGNEEGVVWSGFTWKVWATIALCLFLALTIKKLGVLIDGVIYILIQGLILLPKEKRDKKNVIIIAIIAIAAPFAIYIPFRYLFSVYLPLGILKGVIF